MTVYITKTKILFINSLTSAPKTPVNKTLNFFVLKSFAMKLTQIKHMLHIKEDFLVSNAC